MRRCARCGALLASDHQDDEWCSPCLRSRRGYDPKDDPLFLDKLLECLCSVPPGTTVRPLQALGISYEHRNAVKDGIRTLRRRGYVIEATEREAGYRYRGVGFETHAALPLGLTVTSTASACR